MSRRTRQLDLDLRERARWGGRHAGAGRKPGPNARHAHRPRLPLAARFPCHITLKVRRGLPSLRTVRLVRELERSFAAACDRGRFRLVQYSIQNDHFHAIVEATNERDLASGMKSIGSRLARAVNRIFRRRGAVLADRYHLHVLRTPREVRHALAYVLLNARKHGVRVARIDPFSSGEAFDGWSDVRGSLATRRSEPSALLPPPFVRARCWLLTVGWRKLGLIDVDATPGRSC